MRVITFLVICNSRKISRNSCKLPQFPREIILLVLHRIERRSTQNRAKFKNKILRGKRRSVGISIDTLVE